MTKAVVVGSGPNGLAAAMVLARAGVDVTVFEAADELGGGARSGPSLLPGLVQDYCSAVHPMAAGSSFLAGLDLGARGVRWRRAEVDCAHPLDGGDAVLLHQSIDRTAEGLGRDGWRWRGLFGAPSRGFAELCEDIMQPLLRIPRHPLRLARFGAVAGPPATWVSRVFAEERTRALFTGVAAHAFQRLDLPLVTGIGAGIITAGHAGGWPVVEGGTGRLTTAVIEILTELGVRFETGRRIGLRRELPRHDIAMLDLNPRDAANLLSDVMPRRTLASLRRFRFGPAAFKVDFAIEGGIPWANPEVGRAGTVHLGGDAREIATGERDIVAGRMPQRPFVLLGQQYVADPGRSAGNTHPVYAYAHVPAGYGGDATEAIIAQIERFAPGFRDHVLATGVHTATDLARKNPNFVGGDILTGAKTPLQFTFGPRVTAFPYDTGVSGTYLCSAATPPGPGIHGMSGYNAARRALERLGVPEPVASEGVPIGV